MANNNSSNFDLFKATVEKVAIEFGYYAFFHKIPSDAEKKSGDIEAEEPDSSANGDETAFLTASSDDDLAAAFSHCSIEDSTDRGEDGRPIDVNRFIQKFSENKKDDLRETYTKEQPMNQMICYKYWIFLVSEGSEGWDTKKAGCTDHYKQFEDLGLVGSRSRFRHRAKRLINFAKDLRNADITIEKPHLSRSTIK
jgi:hypothetical protein